VTTAPKLDPVGLALEACRRLWQARDHALLLGIPLLALGVGWDIVYGDDLRGLLLALADAPTMTDAEIAQIQGEVMSLASLLVIPSMLLQAILFGNLARLLLIGPGSIRPLLGLALDTRLLTVVWRFVQIMLIALVASVAISLPLGMVVGVASMAGNIGLGVGLLAGMAAGLAILVICLRLSIAAAATAIDRPMRLAEAWRATAGNATGLLGAILAANLPAVGIGFLLSALLGAILPTMPMTTTLLLNLVALVSSLLSMAVLAVATERLLKKPAPRD
jgi:hypothetical protein